MNWYVYCDANPLVNVDWLGLDAIIMINTGGVQFGPMTLGHMGVLVQNNMGKWFYFSMGKEYIKFQPVNSEHMLSMQSINENYYMNGNTYDESVYIKGDFTAAYDYYKNYFDTVAGEDGLSNDKWVLDFNPDYNSRGFNCSHAVMNGIYAGKLIDGTQVRNFILPKLNYLSLPAFPKDQIRILQGVFYNIAWNYEQYRKQLNDQLWEFENSWDLFGTKAVAASAIR